MDGVYYNTYTISDSEDSVIIENQPRIDSLINRLMMSPEEPEFFHQVIQHQRVRFLKINVLIDH